MVQINEFRIGNWYNQFGNYHQVDWVTFKDLKDSPISQLWFKPIPLTPETISKCVSLKLKDRNEYWDFYVTDNKWYVVYAKHTEPSAGVEIGKFYYGDGFQQVECVHDLQNLYFYTSFKKELEFIW